MRLVHASYSLLVPGAELLFATFAVVTWLEGNAPFILVREGRLGRYDLEGSPSLVFCQLASHGEAYTGSSGTV